MQAHPAAVDDRISLISPRGYNLSSCGYCKSKPKRTRQALSASVYASSDSLLPSHYQALVNRGWRRSGSTYYKPDNRNSCCPHYTIRLDASAFQSTKDQRQAVHRWNTYVLGFQYREHAARLCPRTRQEKKCRRNHFDLVECVHEAEYYIIKKPVDPRTREPIQPAHTFEVTLEPNNYTNEKYALFANYQKVVHHETPAEYSKSGFKSFLCSGLQRSIQLRNGREHKLGSYHQCYRLDGRLVAIGVLDLLPDCVSSVYLIYHESVSDWNFGKLSALQEIALAVEGGYGWYYMGYYIHSCVKMRYKGAYQPSYLLDPETHGWDPLNQDFLNRLSVRNYVSMSRERRLEIPATSVFSFLQSDKLTSSNFEQETRHGLEAFKAAFHYAKGPEDQAAFPKAAENYSSAFDADMPGLVTLDELSAKEDLLGQWTLKLGKIKATLKNLRTWDESELTDTSTIKGIAAELAACIGLDMVEHTILEFPT